MSNFVDFIMSFLLSTEISIFTGYLCLDPNGTREIVNQAFKFGIRVQYCNDFLACRRNYNSDGIVLDLDCEGAIEFLSEASGDRLFGILHTWIIFDDDDLPNSTKIELLLKDVNLLPDSKVIWKTKTSFLDVYKIKTNEKVQIKNIYTKGKDVPISVEQLKTLWNSLPPRSSRRKNLQNVSLRAATIISQPQFFTGWDDLSTKHIDTWPKFTFPIMKNLAQDLNYRVDMKQTDNYGVLQADGTFDGLCGQLQRGEIEFGITSMFMRKDRWEALDFCAETILLKSSFMFRQPPQSTVSNIFLLPFNSDVWFASCSMFFLVGLILSLLAALMKKADRSLKSMKVSEVFSLTIGTICQQGTHLNPYLSSARIIILFTFITSLFIFTSYSAKIVAILQTPSTAIKTISDLAHSPMSLGIQETTYKKVYFTESNDPGTKFLYKYKIAPQGEKAYMSVVEGISRMKKSTFAFQVEASSGYAIISDTYTEREKCGLAEIEAFQLPMVAVPIKKRSGYRDLFSSRLRWQREVGLFDRSKKIWIAQKPICNEGLTGFVSVGIVECLPAIKVMIYGILFSVFIFLNEIITHRFGHRLKTTGSTEILLLATSRRYSGGLQPYSGTEVEKFPPRNVEQFRFRDVIVLTVCSVIAVSDNNQKEKKLGSIMRHASFLARTVFVQNNNVEEACRVINRILGKEGILEQFRLTRYYEKPFQTRRRVNHEKCKAIYNEDMDRKIQFVLRKNRVEPYPGCH